MSAVESTVAYGVLPDRMRIHWTLGMGTYYGPETAPTVLVLAAFPALITSIALGAYWIAGRLRSSEAFAAVRPYYVFAVLGTVAIILGIQTIIVLANLL